MCIDFYFMTISITLEISTIVYLKLTNKIDDSMSMVVLLVLKV